MDLDHRPSSLKVPILGAPGSGAVIRQPAGFVQIVVPGPAHPGRNERSQLRSATLRDQATMLKPRNRDLRSLADEELMQLVRDGEARAFEVIFDRHGGPAFSLAFRMCGRRAMAEDVVQDAFLAIWRSGGRYDQARGSVRSWVLGVVHSRVVDAFRRGVAKEGRDVSDQGSAERIPSPERTEARVTRVETGQEVRVALSDLPIEQRRVIELAYFGGFTHSEIAEMLELPPGTVKGRMRLGLAKLRLTLGDPVRAML
jgi:RNA polymerase sigma-70 factor (ECF subfamily)